MKNKLGLKLGDVCYAVECEAHTFEQDTEIKFIGMKGASSHHEGYYHFEQNGKPRQLMLPGEFKLTKEV